MTFARVMNLINRVLEEQISENWNSLIDEIDSITPQSDRPKVIAVSKTRPIEYIEIAAKLGIKDFGENYAQELSSKHKALSTLNLNWHFIGNLQRRHVKEVVSTAALIHAVSSIKVIEKFGSLSSQIPFLIQYNLSKEESKSGVNSYEEIIALKEKSDDLKLKCVGLMVMSNPNWTSEVKLKKFREGYEVAEEVFGSSVIYSAGMSDDWKEALTAGATHLRIGTRIFGKRE